jgi:site-specific DNA-methyltransferase (adenine-specific)
LYSKEQFRLEKSPESGDPDITGEEFQNWIDSHWAIQPETRPLALHPAIFPVELPSRIIKLYSYPNDIILDPFSGTGTTCLAAKMLNRRYIGIDISPYYCEYARNRLASDVDLFAQ